MFEQRYITPAALPMHNPQIHLGDEEEKSKSVTPAGLTKK